MKEIKWVSAIPLIGGMAIGNYNVVGNKPEFFLTFDAFHNNNSHIKARWKDVPYLTLDNDANYFLKEEDRKLFQKLNKNIDFVSTVCPCAGLSMLNSTSNRGENSTHNQWMYKSSEYILENIKPKVLFGENAPGLFTALGDGVFKKLYEIGKKYNYSFSVIKTNTLFHGIPQNRPRTFYFFWNTKTVPIMEYYKRPYKEFSKFILDAPNDALYYDNSYREETVKKNAFYNYIKEQLGNDWREYFYKNDIKTLYEYCAKDSFKAIEEWLIDKESIYPSAVKKIQHIHKKTAQGLGIWNDSIQVYNSYTNAVITKNMSLMLHPIKDRILNIRELMYLMGLPSDFELVGGEKNSIHISQNVPVQTAADMTTEVIKFLEGKLKFSSYDVLKQDNCSQKIENLKYGNNEFSDFFNDI